MFKSDTNNMVHTFLIMIEINLNHSIKGMNMNIINECLVAIPSSAYQPS